MASNTPKRDSAVAACGYESVEFGEQRVVGTRGAGAQERGEAILQRDALDAPNRVVVDRGEFRDGAEPLAERRGGGAPFLVRRQAVLGQRVDEDRVEKTPVGGVIGASAAAFAGEQHVHRADAEIGGPALRRARGGEAERGEIADALIALVAAQRVELR